MQKVASTTLWAARFQFRRSMGFSIIAIASSKLRCPRVALRCLVPVTYQRTSKSGKRTLSGDRLDAGGFTCSMVFVLEFLIDAEKHLLPKSTASDVETPDPFENNFLGFGQSRAL
jgi:hypothetical protein